MKNLHTHWTFPEDVVEELSRLVADGKRSHFVAEATREALRKLKLLQAVNKAAGSWKSNEHPELKTKKDAERYVRKLRGEWEQRRTGTAPG